MNLFKSVLNFYLQSSIHVSLAVLCFTIATFLEYDLPLIKSVLGFIFLGTITGYNFIKYAGIAGMHHKSLAKNVKLIQLFSFICFAGFLYSMFQISRNVLFASLALGLVTVLYVLPFYRKKNLRNFEGLKIYIVAFVWAGVTVLLPWIASENNLNTDVFLTFLQRFLWVLVLIIPFEIRDLVYDDLTLGTLPQKLGVSKTKWVGYLFLLIMIILQGFKAEIHSSYTAFFIVMLLLTAFLVWFSKQKQSVYFTSFWVEGIPILWVVLLFFEKYYFFIS
ncbi:MAG: hypothetical protein R2781_05575 [Flavobacteriaceae bacterium]